MKIDSIYSQVVEVTQKLINLGLTIQENSPQRSGTEVYWSNITDLSVALISIPYKDKFNVIFKSDNFNFKFVDSAIVQMLYRFDSTSGAIISHRLAYFPAPNIERYNDNIEDYDGAYFGDSEFHDLLDQNVVTVPMRFDYSSDSGMFEEYDHSFCHLTLGEFKNCRISVRRPITPKDFINLILHSFYKTVMVECCNNFKFSVENTFEDSITGSEKEYAFIDI